MFFPIGDDNRRVMTMPIVTTALVILNVLVFLYQVALGPATQDFIIRWGVIPARLLDGSGYETLISSMFLHGGWAHLIGNMVFLWVFGDNVEDAFGHWRYLLFYLLTGLAASAAHIGLNLTSTIPSVGASGAISGVLGAYIVLFGRNAVRVLFFPFFVFLVPAWMMIGLWALQQFIATFASIGHTMQTGGVAYAAHAGGFLAGVLVALIARPFISRREAPSQRIITHTRRY